MSGQHAKLQVLRGKGDMGFVPVNSEWYLAEIVQELTVEDDPSNLIWRNLTLVKATSPDEAYELAIELGLAGDTEYLNSSGKRVTVRYRGMASLDVVHGALEHGAELSFRSDVDVTPEQLRALLCSKQDLNLFLPITHLRGPDVTSGRNRQRAGVTIWTHRTAKKSNSLI